jgi:hypothetical protein
VGRQLAQRESSAYWLQPPLSRRAAEAILLSDGLEGGFVVRQSLDPQGDLLVLSHCAAGQIYHHRIDAVPGGFIFQSLVFPTLQLLVEHLTRPRRELGWTHPLFLRKTPSSSSATPDGSHQMTRVTQPASTTALHQQVRQQHSAAAAAAATVAPTRSPQVADKEPVFTTTHSAAPQKTLFQRIKGSFSGGDGARAAAAAAAAATGQDPACDWANPWFAADGSGEELDLRRNPITERLPDYRLHVIAALPTQRVQAAAGAAFA